MNHLLILAFHAPLSYGIASLLAASLIIQACRRTSNFDENFLPSGDIFPPRDLLLGEVLQFRDPPTRASSFIIIISSDLIINKKTTSLLTFPHEMRVSDPRSQIWGSLHRYLTSINITYHNISLFSTGTVYRYCKRSTCTKVATLTFQRGTSRDPTSEEKQATRRQIL